MLFGSHGNKATVVRGELIDQFSDTSLSIVAIEEFVKPDNIDKLIQEDDIIIMAVDNLATRKIINGHVSKLNSITLVSAGNDGVEPNEDPPQFGTYGNCQYYVRQNGEDLGPSLTTYHPEIENPTDKLPEESCTEAILSSPQLLAANLMAASAIINTLWLHLCGKMFYAELSFDISAAKMSPWPIPLKTAPQTVEFGAEMAIEESPDS
jgi:molybdopterin/thiamine biosynthesis adenylyltransferase